MTWNLLSRVWGLGLGFRDKVVSGVGFLGLGIRWFKLLSLGIKWPQV